MNVYYVYVCMYYVRRYARMYYILYMYVRMCVYLL